jgi:hypothetical protein
MAYLLLVLANWLLTYLPVAIAVTLRPISLNNTKPDVAIANSMDL